MPKIDNFISKQSSQSRLDFPVFFRQKPIKNVIHNQQRIGHESYLLVISETFLQSGSEGETKQDFDEKERQKKKQKMIDVFLELNCKKFGPQ